ncbi:Protein CBG20413 [Caenorhabditis briggsae]|uniref:Protein CBG20413 n=1 Tax=Caenorhabditis briggsae TaxID=6238 RepID=A8XXQ7_CAEBR|nr:Protein CBG20413 [Caenorhabditis briggsae]CAP37426.1 Protein CBG20413 [Caenorhabditis briggsae]
MAKTKVTAPRNTNVETKADIKKKIQFLGDEYATAIKAHQKASEDVKRLQQQQEATEKKIQRLTVLHQMHQKRKIQKPKSICSIPML